MKKLHLLFALLSIHFLSAQVLVNSGTAWKYLDDGSDQGTAWRIASYNDDSWASGNAQLGYGDGDENTVISYGSSSSNKHICYYFRKTFNVSDPTANSGLKISLLRDDGAVVYINGQEVVRSNMPSGTITYTTLAASTVAGSDEDVFNIYNVPSSALISGQNLIAVEVHQRSHSSSDVSFDLKLEFAAIEYYQKQPYLLLTDSGDQMKICWQLNSTMPCTVDYGTDTNYTSGSIDSNETDSSHIHEVVLDGLSPDETYYYRVTVDGEGAMTGSFQSAPDGNAQSITFFAYGDNRTYPSSHNFVAQRILSDINDNGLKHTFILNSGDLVSDGDTEGSWESEFFATQYGNIRELMANLPYMAAVGNHEGQGILFSKYFPYPMYQNGRYYYSFDYGPAHFTVIDQFTSYAQGSTQYNWIVNDLSTSDKPWKICIFHEPGWSAGGHSNSYMVQNTLQPLLVQYNVRVVLTGHNHYYARAVVDGIHHITTGGGGAPLYSPNSSYPNIVKVSQSHHYCKLEIDGDNLHISAIKDNGSLIEEFDVQALSTDDPESDALDHSWFVYAREGKIIVNTTDLSGQVEIYDDIGRKLFSAQAGAALEFSPANTGMYFVRYIEGERKSIKKVLNLQ